MLVFCCTSSSERPYRCDEGGQWLFVLLDFTVSWKTLVELVPSYLRRPVITGRLPMTSYRPTVTDPPTISEGAIATLTSVMSI